jgi:hypothetical protein
MSIKKCPNEFVHELKDLNPKTKCKKCKKTVTEIVKDIDKKLKKLKYGSHFDGEQWD